MGPFAFLETATQRPQKKLPSTGRTMHQREKIPASACANEELPMLHQASYHSATEDGRVSVRNTCDAEPQDLPAQERNFRSKHVTSLPSDSMLLDLGSLSRHWPLHIGIQEQQERELRAHRAKHPRSIVPLLFFSIPRSPDGSLMARVATASRVVVGWSLLGSG